MRSVTPAGPLAPLLAILALAGCQEEIEPPMYQIVSVTERSITVSVKAEGLIEPIQTVEVKSKASGEITPLAGARTSVSSCAILASCSVRRARMS